MNSLHTNKTDVELNKSMRIISGPVKSTPLPWQPVLSNIAPPDIRRPSCASRLIMCCNINSLLFQELQNFPVDRLVSRELI